MRFFELAHVIGVEKALVAYVCRFDALPPLLPALTCHQWLYVHFDLAKCAPVFCDDVLEVAYQKIVHYDDARKFYHRVSADALWHDKAFSKMRELASEENGYWEIVENLPKFSPLRAHYIELIFNEKKSTRDKIELINLLSRKSKMRLKLIERMLAESTHPGAWYAMQDGIMHASWLQERVVRLMRDVPADPHFDYWARLSVSESAEQVFRDVAIEKLKECNRPMRFWIERWINIPPGFLLDPVYEELIMSASDAVPDDYVRLFDIAKGHRCGQKLVQFALERLGSYLDAPISSPEQPSS